MLNRIVLVIFLGVIFVLPRISHAIPTVTTGSAAVSAGDKFIIPISIADAVDLMSWQYDLSFNSVILQANAVTEAPFLSSSGTHLTLFSPGAIDNGLSLNNISSVTNAYVDLPPGPSGSGILATIEFTAVAAGVSPLTLSNVFLNFSNTGFNVVNGQVASVPEPSTLGLFMLGIAVLVLRLRPTRDRMHPSEMS